MWRWHPVLTFSSNTLLLLCSFQTRTMSSLGTQSSLFSGLVPCLWAYFWSKPQSTELHNALMVYYIVLLQILDHVSQHIWAELIDLNVTGNITSLACQPQINSGQGSRLAHFSLTQLAVLVSSHLPCAACPSASPEPSWWNVCRPPSSGTSPALACSAPYLALPHLSIAA